MDSAAGTSAAAPPTLTPPKPLYVVLLSAVVRAQPSSLCWRGHTHEVSIANVSVVCCCKEGSQKMFLPQRHNYCMGILPMPLFSLHHCILLPQALHPPLPLWLHSCFCCCPPLTPCYESRSPFPLPHSTVPTVPVAVHDGVEAVGDSKDSAVSELSPDCCLD